MKLRMNGPPGGLSNSRVKSKSEKQIPCGNDNQRSKGKSLLAGDTNLCKELIGLHAGGGLVPVVEEKPLEEHCGEEEGEA